MDKINLIPSHNIMESEVFFFFNNKGTGMLKLLPYSKILVSTRYALVIYDYTTSCWFCLHYQWETDNGLDR